MVVLVLTSGFVAGTTATFSASTRNDGTFTVAGIETPSSPTISLSGTTANFAFTPVGNTPNNTNIGYRILRKAVGGPTTTAGSGSAPGCSGGTYATVGYASIPTYPDGTIPSTAADQGEFFCYAAEGVFPCCPTTGKNPVITSLGGRIQTAVQAGYVVANWQFNSGNGNQTPASGEKLVINFNQPVNTATSVTAAENLCVDPYNKRILFGVTSSAADFCQYEVQRLTFSSGTPSSSRDYTLTVDGVTTADIPCNSTATTVQNALAAAGIDTVYVKRTTTSPWTFHFFYAGTKTGDRNQITAAHSPVCRTTGNQNMTLTTATVANGTTEAMSIGYLSNAGNWTSSVSSGVCASPCILPSRYDITGVAWTNLNRTLTVTLGNRIGTNNAILPTGTWTMNPSSAVNKSTSAAGALTLCTTDPAGAPTGGLCKPTTTAGW